MKNRGKAETSSRTDQPLPIRAQIYKKNMCKRVNTPIRSAIISPLFGEEDREHRSLHRRLSVRHK